MNEELLKLIEKSCVIDTKALAARTGEDEDKLAAEIRELQAAGILCGCHALINWDEANDERVTALIEIKVTPHKELGYNRIAARISKIDEVSAVYLMSGPFDFTVIITGKTMREISRIVMDKLAIIDAVESTATHFILKKYKENGIEFVQSADDRRMSITP